ncbi:MAG TPA: cytochrome c oxidase assembly protein [Acidimicrobiales bacterium]|nr:cytochrome c oxidase assembly protein [Acidimicrobiales bacterium]
MEFVWTLAALEGDLKPQPWRWVPHPEVWVMVAVLVLMYLYATRVIGPKVVPAGEPIITRSQSRWFFTGLVLLWIAVDWPLHDLAEDYLYSIHMIQHLMLTWVIPPMMLMAMPEWLARLVLGRGRTYEVFRLITRPLFAGLLYTALFALSHLPTIVDDSVRWSSVHFSVHLIIVLSALLMWNCVCGPLKELRSSLPVQCIYLFLLGVFPIIPGAWLTYSQDVVYKVYIHPWHSFWGLTPLGDQQIAGFIMRVIGGTYAGVIIIVLFFRWARELTENDDEDLRSRDRERIARFRAEHPDPLTSNERTGQPTPG